MQNSLIRPAWTPVTIAAMVFGFMIAWPLGLAMLAYIIWGERLEGFKTNVNRTTDDVCGKFRWSNWKQGGDNWGAHGRSGNVAFDDWRDTEMERLNEERRKLDEMRREFDAYQRDLRRAKDKQEFDEFMKGRSRPSTSADAEDRPTSTLPEKARRKKD